MRVLCFRSCSACACNCACDRHWGRQPLSLPNNERVAEGDCSLGVEGLQSAIPGVEGLQSVIPGVEGGSFFSHRRGTASRARNGGGCVAIGVGFTTALRPCGKSGVERATTASAIGYSNRPDAALYFAYRSSVLAGSSAGFFPAASAGCFTTELPSQATADSFTTGRGCSPSAVVGSYLAATGYFTAGGGCSSPVAAGSSLTA
ncbi:hypothetical protein BHE74_00036916 [Ensete ventricosum]|nr:hypothetical protein GW17_00049532 [Ensete ventricosum]RWW56369.1 hypothetical protein BHE74_00036916 [Ensete ventricosum]